MTRGDKEAAREHLRYILDNGNKLAVHAKAEDLMAGLD